MIRRGELNEDQLDTLLQSLLACAQFGLQGVIDLTDAGAGRADVAATKGETVVLVEAKMGPDSRVQEGKHYVAFSLPSSQEALDDLHKLIVESMEEQTAGRPSLVEDLARAAGMQWSGEPVLQPSAAMAVSSGGGSTTEPVVPSGTPTGSGSMTEAETKRAVLRTQLAQSDRRAEAARQRVHEARLELKRLRKSVR